MSFGSTYSNNPRRIHSYLFFQNATAFERSRFHLYYIYLCVRVQSNLEFVRRKELQVKLSTGLDRDQITDFPHPAAYCLT